MPIVFLVIFDGPANPMCRTEMSTPRPGAEAKDRTF